MWLIGWPCHAQGPLFLQCGAFTLAGVASCPFDSDTCVSETCVSDAPLVVTGQVHNGQGLHPQLQDGVRPLPGAHGRPRGHRGSREEAAPGPLPRAALQGDPVPLRQHLLRRCLLRPHQHGVPGESVSQSYSRLDLFLPPRALIKYLTVIVRVSLQHHFQLRASHQLLSMQQQQLSTYAIRTHVTFCHAVLPCCLCSLLQYSSCTAHPSLVAEQAVCKWFCQCLPTSTTASDDFQ